MSKSGLLPRLLCAYRAGHSTETAVLKVLSDILFAIDAGDLPALVLMDLLAAFDAVDHDILIRRVNSSYDLLVWCFSGSTYIVLDRLAPVCPKRILGMQGSGSRPNTFLLYTADLIMLIDMQVIHRYMDFAVRQRHGSCRTPSPTVLMMLQGGCVQTGSSC